MLEIQFRTDELTARQVHLAATIDSNPVGNILTMIDFIVDRSVGLDVEAVKTVAIELWLLPISKLFRLFGNACSAAAPATTLALEKERAETQSRSVTGTDADETEQMFNQGRDEGFEM